MLRTRCQEIVLSIWVMPSNGVRKSWGSRLLKEAPLS